MTDLVQLINTTPHAAELGMEQASCDGKTITLKIPYKPELIGDPDRGILHGGVVTTLIDTCSGAAAFLATEQKEMIATLDLRIDYLKPAMPGEAVLATASCYRITSEVLFVSCTAFQNSPDNCIAKSMSTFVRNGFMPENTEWNS